MKKIVMILLIILVMCFVPKVYAADGVAIESVTVDSKSESAVIVNPATFEGLSLKMDIKFDNINDYVKYKLVIKNSSDTDYELVESTSSSTYITYEYGYEDGSKVLTANSSKTMFITVKYSSSVPATEFTSGNYTEEKNIVINLDDGTDEITVPSTSDGLYCYLVLLVGTLVFSISLFKATKNKKFLVLIIASMILIPLDIHAIVKLKIDINSKVEINNPNEITEIIYWALQENGTTEGYDYSIDPPILIQLSTYRLVISNKEQDGIYKGSFAGTTEFTADEFTGDNDIPWLTDQFVSDYVNEVKIEGKVVPTSTTYWFYYLGCEVDNVSFDLTNLNTINVTNMASMFAGAGSRAKTFNLDLSGFNTSNVTNMARMFAGAGYNVTTFNLDLSGWNTSNVTSMSGMFCSTGIFASEKNILLPETNGNGIVNQSGTIYGMNASVYALTSNDPICGK